MCVRSRTSLPPNVRNKQTACLEIEKKAHLESRVYRLGAPQARLVCLELHQRAQVLPQG